MNETDKVLDFLLQFNLKNIVQGKILNQSY